MSNFILMFICLMAGIALRSSGRLPESGPSAIQATIVNVSLPALTLSHMHRFPFDTDHLGPLLMPWLLFVLGVVFFASIGHLLGLTRGSTGALILVGGFGNTSFVGVPMIEALYGKDGIGLGMAIDQLGSYLALSTIGLLVAALYASGERPTLRAIAQRVFTFPPFVALVLAIALSRLEFPHPLQVALGRIGDTVAPLALLWVGTQLRLSEMSSQRHLLALGLGFKLVICPLIVIALLVITADSVGMVEQVVIIQAAMPPMIGAAVVASQAGLAPRLVASMIGLGIPLGLLVAPLWFHLYLSIT